MSHYAQLLKLIRSRRSVRRFSNRAVSREDMVRLLEAARWAPSNHNRQPWRFIIIEDNKQISQLAETVSQGLSEKLKSLPEVAARYISQFKQNATFFANAPVLVVVLHKQPVSVSAPVLAGLKNPDLVSGEPLSVAMAVQNFLLSAQALGLGTCVLTGPLLAQDVLVGVLGLPAGHDLTCLVALGYPAESPAPPRRKTIEQIAEFRNKSRRTKH
ncbi:MAG TPA: nitroreductase family protein [Verrucomicrobiae bacterium]|nr:nitroreductase family protein [Verrucomicrobiae bacterium]